MWIESHQSLGGHPKTRKLAHKLEIKIPQTMGHLTLLWHWAMDYAPDGDLSRYDAEDIAIAAQWDGNADDFKEALVACGWIDCDDDGERIHDWYDFAGKLIERRAKNAERMRLARATNVHGTDEESGHESSDSGGATHVQATQRARAELQDRTRPDQPKRTGPDQPAPTTNGGPDPFDESQTPQAQLSKRLVGICKKPTSSHTTFKANQIVGHALTVLAEPEVERLIAWAEGLQPDDPGILWEPVKQRAVELQGSLPHDWKTSLRAADDW